MTNQLFIPFHFAGAAANRLTNAALDPVCKIPELKVCTVNIFSEQRS
jgi:predicted molibdopterin-dependent oxidoreductase YjgC